MRQTIVEADNRLKELAEATYESIIEELAEDEEEYIHLMDLISKYQFLSLN